MKSLCFLAISISLLLPCDIFSQDTASIIKSYWMNLTTQLKSRTEIVSNLENVLSKSAAADKEYLEKSKAFAVDLNSYLDTMNSIDSSAILQASNKDRRLTQTLSRVLVSLENDQKFRNSPEVFKHISQLEECEKRIYVAKKDYNDICLKFGRIELFFGKNPNEKLPEVKF
jgi:hypothetical protein